MHAYLGPRFFSLLAPLLLLLRQLAQHRAAPRLPARRRLVSRAHLDKRSMGTTSDKQPYCHQDATQRAETSDRQLARLKSARDTGYPCLHRPQATTLAGASVPAQLQLRQGRCSPAEACSRAKALLRCQCLRKLPAAQQAHRALASGRCTAQHEHARQRV